MVNGEDISAIIAVLAKLVSFKSVTPNGRDAIDYVAATLAKAGFKCYIKNFGTGQEVTNLYAIYGDNEPNICFAGHLDVVPPMDEILWYSDPFTLHIDQDKISGRGVVDMKGAIACSIVAVLTFLQNNPCFTGAISFLLTTDEEGAAIYGTKAMLDYIKHFRPKMNFCILGEPTSRKYFGDTIKIGRRGSINFTLKVKGMQGHVAYPEEASNPIPELIRVINILTRLKLDAGSGFFAPSNLELTSIDAENKVTNIIPESVTAKFNIRFNDNYTGQSLQHYIEQVVDGVRIKDSPYIYLIDAAIAADCFIQEFSTSMQEFAAIVQNVTGLQPAIENGGGTSDARFIQSNCAVIEFGLHSNAAHKINEYTQIKDLQKLYKVYYFSLTKFLRGV